MVTRRWDKSKPPLGPFVLNKDCPQAQGLVAWYPFNGASSKFVPDRCGKTHIDSGTPPVLTIGRHGEPTALFTAASSQYLNTTRQPVSAYPFSVSSWFKPRTVATSVIVGAAETSSTTNYWGMVLISGGTLRAQIASGGGAAHISETSAVVSAGAWQYVVNTYTDSTTNQVYLNTVAGTARDSNSNAFPTSNNFGIASWQHSGSGLYFDGEIGETCIWDRVISTADIVRGYDLGRRFELWYPLRSRKWISIPAGGAFNPAWARQRSQIIGAGAR